MTNPVLLTLQIADASAFLLVGLLALDDWRHGRDRRRGYLAVALGCFGLVVLGLEAELLTGPDAWISGALIFLLMASAAGLVLYRSVLLPMPRWARFVTGFVLVGGGAFGYAAGLPAATGQGGLSALQSVALNVLLGAWCVTVAEPAYRLARLASGLPPVQRARMQSLAAGYSGLVVVAALTIVGIALRGDWLAILLQAVALLCVPPLYVGLAPPGWLHRLWRQAEEVRLRRAIQDLLLFTPDRATLARHGLDWAIRLVGAEAGLVAEADGTLLAVQGLEAAEARRLLERPSAQTDARLVRVGPVTTRAIIQPLALQGGSATLVIVAGKLSPTFGDDEVEWIAAYAASLAIALDRARVAELAVRREAELERARDLAERASTAKTEFLSRMSHELRTPLTAVIGFSELLLLEGLGERRERHVSTILKAGEHLLGLIDDILDIARIEEGRLPLAQEVIDIAPLAAEVLDLVRPMSGEREVTIGISPIAPELRVVGDRQRVKQVLLNLVSNAVKYNRRGGWVEVSASLLEDRAHVTVQDTGPGLRPEEVERLFSPFERLSAAASEVEGTGLGLALSKSLAEAMGGSVGVESTVGAGSTFWVDLPSAERPAPAFVPTATPDGGARETAPMARLVLYVEDNPANVALMEDILASRTGLSLVSAGRGRRALQLARERRPDLILLDAHLPDMDSVDILGELGADPATAQVPVLVLSADATRHQIDRLLQAGASEYLTKPIRVAELLQAISRHLRQGGTPAADAPVAGTGATMRTDVLLVPSEP